MLLMLVVGAFALGAFGQLAWQRYGDDLQEARRSLEPAKLPSLKLPDVMNKGPSRLVYLNREGALLLGDGDDASRNRSSIVAAAGLDRVQIPAFAGNPNRWDQFVNCVRSKFEPYEVEVVDQRPVEGSYIMAVIGGRPAVLGQDIPVVAKGVTGLAPFSGEPIRDAVVMVFAREMKERTRAVCETAAMEIAHAFGLDHARHCKDIMTYMRPCGPKRFLDEPIPCGELENRACKGGAPTQNSHARLMEILGPRRPRELAPVRKASRGGSRKGGVSAGPVQRADDGHFHEH